MKHKAWKRSSTEDKVRIILEPNKVMGIVPKPLLLSLCLFSLLTFSSCASLPRIEDYGLLSADNTPKIIGPRGERTPGLN